MRRWRMEEEMEENDGDRWRMGEVLEQNGRLVGENGEDKRLHSEEAIFNVSTEPIEKDMFEDSPDDEQDHNKEEVALNSTNIVKQIDFEGLDTKEEGDDGFNDGFDEDLNDGQDSFLIAASQMVEDPVIKEEVASVVKQELVNVDKDKKATTFKFKRESKVLLPPAVARLQQMGGSDGFGSDDSFDEQMSQLPPGGFGTPASPVLKKRHQSPSTSSGSPALSTRSRSFKDLGPDPSLKVSVSESVKPAGAALK